MQGSDLQFETAHLRLLQTYPLQLPHANSNPWSIITYVGVGAAVVELGVGVGVHGVGICELPSVSGLTLRVSCADTCEGVRIRDIKS